MSAMPTTERNLTERSEGQMSEGAIPPYALFPSHHVPSLSEGLGSEIAGLSTETGGDTPLGTGPKPLGTGVGTGSRWSRFRWYECESVSPGFSPLWHPGESMGRSVCDDPAEAP